MPLRPLLVGAIAAVLTARLAVSALPAAAAPLKTPPNPSGRADTAQRQSGPELGRLVTTPTLVQRATLSADYIAPGPPSGAKAVRFTEAPAVRRSIMHTGRTTRGADAYRDVPRQLVADRAA